MDSTNIEKIRQVIEQLSQQINHLDASMCIDILSKSVLAKEEISNLVISIAEHKFLIEQLEKDIDNALVLRHISFAFSCWYGMMVLTRVDSDDASVAFDLTQLFDMRYTPKSASWLNMVEIELSVLSRQCLSRRIGQVSELQRQVNAWAEARNRKQVRVNWQFTLKHARKKFKQFYHNSLS